MNEPAPVKAFDYVLLMQEDPEPQKPKRRKARPWKKRKR